MLLIWLTGNTRNIALQLGYTVSVTQYLLSTTYDKVHLLYVLQVKIKFR